MELFVRTCKFDRMNLERLAARLFVLAGGLFWFLAAIGATSYLDEGGDAVLNQAWVLLGLTVVVFLMGWFYEVLTAVFLVVITVAFVVVGVVSEPISEPGVWALWLLFTAAPSLIAATLFFLAARMQKICRLEGVTE
jgi:hypothetical protein